MKFKSLLYIGGATAILSVGQSIQADQVMTHPETITSQTNQSISAQFSAQLRDDELVLTVSQVSIPIEQVKGWIVVEGESNQKIDVIFEQQADKSYQAHLNATGLQLDTAQLKAQIVLEEGKQISHSLKEYAFKWQTASINETDETSSVSTENTVNESSSATTDTDSEISASASTIETTETTTEEPAKEERATAFYSATRTSANPTISIDSINVQAGTFTVRAVNLPTDTKVVRIPVWSDENGQDDLKWYTAIRQSDGSYSVLVDKKDHKNSSGRYQVHLYYTNTAGKTFGLAATTANLAVQTTGTIVAENIDTQNGTVTLRVRNVQASSAIASVKVPVWSDTEGQDDLKWYTAARQSDGSYTVEIDKKNHKNAAGLYHAHLYYQYQDGKSQGVSATKFYLDSKPQGKISVEDVNAKTGQFTVRISDVYAPEDIQTVKVPIWTEDGGQDDIRWYNATKQSDGTYTVVVNKKDHKEGIGQYQIHLYYQYADGKMSGVSGIKATMTALALKAQGQLSIENINPVAGTFDVFVSNVIAPDGLRTVKIPVWSDQDGQDDIRWYNASLQADGRYKITVDRKNHKNGTGTYQVHLYFENTTGKVQGISAIKAQLPVAAAAGKISIQNINNGKGTFDVIASDVDSPKGVSKVLIPVWSEDGGQDDIRWYEASLQGDGTYKVSVQASQHHYSTGVYQAHLYIQQGDGSQVGLAATQAGILMTQAEPNATIQIQNIDNVYGVFDVVVSDIFAPAGLEKVEVPVWSTANGQNDIVWYQAFKQNDGTYRVTVQLSNHAYETGEYNAHLYLTSNGKRVGAGATKAQVNYRKKAGQSFVDVSSHNGQLTETDYRALMSQGVSGVVVKLTEGTGYLNPFAEMQIKNAQAVGLKVSVYHYSHFTTTEEAQAEARYFAAAAKKLGLSTSTVMVNDIEESKTRTNINENMKEWEGEMKRLGYSNLIHYTSASWIDVNTLGYSGPIKTSLFGLKNFWVAQYPYVNGMSDDKARELSMHAGAAAWQFTSKATLLLGHSYFDLNIDYTGRFTD